MDKYLIVPLTQDKFDEAVELIFRANLGTIDEIEHHLQHLNAHYAAIVENKVVGVIGWYQDNVHYADNAMGNKFPGENAYWVGFFAVDKDYQGKGIGTALLQKLENVIMNKKEYMLWVSSVPETKNYYENKGFALILEGKIDGRQKFFLSKKLNLNHNREY